MRAGPDPLTVHLSCRSRRREHPSKHFLADGPLRSLPRGKSMPSCRCPCPCRSGDLHFTSWFRGSCELWTRCWLTGTRTDFRAFGLQSSPQHRSSVSVGGCAWLPWVSHPASIGVRGFTQTHGRAGATSPSRASERRRCGCWAPRLGDGLSRPTGGSPLRRVGIMAPEVRAPSHDGPSHRRTSLRGGVEGAEGRSSADRVLSLGIHPSCSLPPFPVDGVAVVRRGWESDFTSNALANGSLARDARELGAHAAWILGVVQSPSPGQAGTRGTLPDP